MKLSGLPKTTEKSKKRIGRGHGSGRGGHTSTRGTKGQKSRGSIGLFFEGTKFKKSLLKRLPLLRGKGKFNAFDPKPAVINLKYLNLFKEGEEVTLETLKQKGILTKGLPSGVKVKILGDGEIGVPLNVLLPTSKQAKEKIEKAGGRVIIGGEKAKVKEEKTPEKISQKEVKETRKGKRIKSSNIKEKSEEQIPI